MKSVDQACSILRKRLSTGSWVLGERLPSLTKLALLCGVSRITMWKAINILKKEMLVHVTNGGPIIAGPVGVHRQVPAQTGYAWERLKTRIGREILTGEFTDIELPPINKMAREYDAAIDTIKKALKSLALDGLLIRSGRRYRQKSRQASGYNRAIVLISQGNTEKGPFLSDPRNALLIESFERECQRTGHAGLSEWFDDHSPKSLIIFKALIKNAGDLAGFIVNMWQPWNETYRQAWDDLLLYLVTRNVPVIAIDHEGNLIFPQSLFGSRYFRVLRIAGIRAGEMVAEALLKQGHKQISYVTPYFSFDWAKNRFEGLRRFVEKYGPAGSKVNLYAQTEITDPGDLTLALLNLDNKDFAALYREHASPDELRFLTKRLEQIRRSGQPKVVASDSVSKTIRDFARYLAGLAKRPHDPAALETALTGLIHSASNAGQDSYLVPLFTSALSGSSSTAWVCSDDKVVWSAINFLKSMKKAVPKDISVIGFDNWQESRERGLSTYDFNMDGIMKKAMLLIRDSVSLKNQPPLIEHEGYVVERRTTRK